jgi:anti-sigma B factor antagonist
MNIKIRTNNVIYIIDLFGEMELYDSNQLKELVLKMVEKKIERFIIDVKHLRTIDSSGIGAFIYISSTLRKMDYQFAIANVEGSCKAVLEKIKLSNYFPIYNSIAEAIKALS